MLRMMMQLGRGGQLPLRLSLRAPHPPSGHLTTNTSNSSRLELFRHCRRCLLSSDAKQQQQQDDDMAAKLHHELQQVLEQKRAVSQQGKGGGGGGFIQFLRTNKGPLLNMGASFFCVLLAYQIIALRKNGRDRQVELETTKAELLATQKLLHYMSSDPTFSKTMAQHVASAICQHNNHSTTSSRWWFWRQKSNEQVVLVNEIQSILNRQLQETIGTTGLTEKQKKQLEMKKFIETETAASAAAATGTAAIEMDETFALVETASGQTIVQKRVFSI